MLLTRCKSFFADISDTKLHDMFFAVSFATKQIFLMSIFGTRTRYFQPEHDLFLTQSECEPKPDQDSRHTSSLC